MGFMVQQVGSIPAISHNIKIGKNMLKEETVAYTVKEGLPLWEQDKKFIIELIKEDRK